MTGTYTIHAGQKECDREEKINERFKNQKINCVAIRTIHTQQKKNSTEEKKKRRR